MDISNKVKPLDASFLGRWAAVFFLVGVALSGLLYYSSFSRASLVVEVEAATPGRSQLFFGKDQAYSQANSSWENIKPGHNKLIFPLSGEYSSIRWDLLQEPGTLKVTDIYVLAFEEKLNTGVIKLEALNDIAQLQQVNSGGIISTTADAKDPQVNVSLDFHGLAKKRFLKSSLIGFLLAILVMLGLLFRSSLYTFLNDMEVLIERIQAKFRRDGFNYKEVAWLIGIGCIFYSYFLSSFSFSIDDEMAAVRQDPAVWVSQGRWFVYLTEKYIFPQSAIPFAPYVFLVISFALSYALILRAHNYIPDWKSYAIYPVFCAFPTWWFISEFYSNVPAVAFGIFFISLSLYMVFIKTQLKRGTLLLACAKNFIIILMLACATSAYQSLLLVYITMIFGALLIRSRNEVGHGGALLKASIFFLLKNALVVVASIICYGLINLLSQKFIAADSGYVGKFLNYKVILEQPVEVLLAILNEMRNIYAGDSVRYGTDIGLATLVVACATLSILSRRLGKTAVRLVLWIGVLTVPFALHFLSGGAPLPMRAMLAIAYVSWLACLIVLSNQRRLTLVFAVLLVSVYQLQIFSVTSQYIASATITQAHDRALAADIYEKIGALSSDFDRTSPLEIDVYGYKLVKTLYATGWWATMQGSFFGWDDGSLDRMLNYMKVMGYENLSAPPDDQRVAMTPIFRDMPVWPAAGSVRKVGNRYLVRLGKEPDPMHAQFTP
jgi:hypothetical protein